MQSQPSPPSPGHPPEDLPRDLVANAAATPSGAGGPANWRQSISRGAAGLCLSLLIGTVFLISPMPGQTYPGALPWSDSSLLRPLTEVMSLWNTFPTARGVEIKDLLLYFSAAGGLGLLAFAAWRRSTDPGARQRAGDRWLAAQAFFILWVLIAAASALWSGDPSLSLGQAAVYGLCVAWAVSLAWTIEARHALHMLNGLVVITCGAALLCAWYYYERNPFHRPGFPLGNPSILGALAMAGLVLALGKAGSLVAAAREQQRPLPTGRLALSAIAVVILAFGLNLTGSRGALLGLGVAAAAAVLLHVGPRVRWWLAAGGFVALAATGWWLSTHANDMAMARGATIRFRAYAWRYAAELWATRSISGHGAAAYPRLSGPLSASDRAVDPAAFMGETVEHAHNELFEVFAEIGLVGGLAFVAAYVATIAAAFALVRGPHSPARRWMLTALAAALAGLMADSLFGVGLRLPGVPAVHYTLLGLLWALSRSLSRDPAAESAPRAPAYMQRCRIAALLAAAACLGCAVAAVQNARGLIHEQLAEEAAMTNNMRDGLGHAQRAADLLLDPVRRLLAMQRQLEFRYALTDRRLTEWRELRAPAASAPIDAPPAAAAARAAALSEALGLYEAALRLHQRAPLFARATLAAALAAERVAELGGDGVAPAGAWRERAWAAWLARRAQRPYEAQTLLSLLARYPATLETRVGLLRDALREGFPTPEWFAALQMLAAAPGFDETIQGLIDAAGPYDPRSDQNALLLAAAPESFRLGASWAALNQNFSAALQRSERAVALYEPLRPRLPDLYSVALAEQAEYAFLNAPLQPDHAVALARRALESLPPIQEQKLETLARPFRVRLAKYLLADGRVDEADEALRRVAPDPQELRALRAGLHIELAGAMIRAAPEDRPPVDRWLDAVLRDDPRNLRAWGLKAWLVAEAGRADQFESLLLDAARQGLNVEDLVRIRAAICHEFPALCESADP